MSAFSWAVGQIPATQTSDSAAAGCVGAYLENSVALNSVSLTTNTPVNVGTVSLTPGDWDVQGAAYFLPGGTTTVTQLWASITQNSASPALGPGFFAAQDYPASYVMGGGIYTSMIVNIVRVSLSATTSWFVVAQATFLTSTMTAGGFIRARRIR